MTFGKLGKPIQFLSKPYEDCLSEIVVTHYPRYRIDMQLQEKNQPTIFEKMNIDYDELRTMDNPVPVVSRYYKSQLKQGESLWWAADEVESSTPMTARLWTALSHEEKEHLTVAGYALFPEVLSAGNNKKYNRYALWLATKKGVINTNIRDSFSAGGKVDMPTKGGILVKMPAAFGRIKRYKDLIEEIITEANANVLSEYWNADIQEDRLTQWCEMVAKEADSSVGYSIAWNVLSGIFLHIDKNFAWSAVSQINEEQNPYDKFAPVGYSVINNKTNLTGKIVMISKGIMRVEYEDQTVEEFDYPNSFLDHTLILLPNV